MNMRSAKDQEDHEQEREALGAAFERFWRAPGTKARVGFDQNAKIASIAFEEGWAAARGRRWR